MSNNEIIGKRFGRLKAIKTLESFDYNNKPNILCICDCGNKTIVSSTNLKRRRHTKSCACLQKEKSKQAKTTHNKWYTDTYKVWHNMMQRCNNSKNHAYKYYGGRNIKVCNEWHNFQNFYKDMGDKPLKLTLDRIDTNGNYEPSNCRWATMQEQTANRNKRGFLNVK